MGTPQDHLLEGLPKVTNLENLPTEIAILLLLNLPDPTSLRALVRASPFYHTLYSHKRRLFLSTALFNCLLYDGLNIALTVQEASVILREVNIQNNFGSEGGLIRRKKTIRDRFFEQPSSILVSRHWLDNIDFDILLSTLHYHWKVASVASKYIEETLSVNPVTREPRSAHAYQTASRSESHRVYRALYYFELYCLLFGSYNPDSSPSLFGQGSPKSSQRVELNFVENQFSVLHFLPLLASWEIEEIACIRHYILNQYTIILQNCASELERLDLEVDDQASPPIDHLFDISTPTMEDERKEYLMSLGLTFLSTVSFSANVSIQARLINQKPWRRVHFLSRAIRAFRELERFDQPVSTYNNTTLTFIGENDGPNAALPWSGFSDPEFFYQGRDFLRSWGYVMWDRSRLEGWRVLEKDPATWLEDKNVAPRVLLNRYGRPVSIEETLNWPFWRRYNKLIFAP